MEGTARFQVRDRPGPRGLQRRNCPRAGELSARGRDAPASEYLSSDSPIYASQRRNWCIRPGPLATARWTAAGAGAEVRLGRDHTTSAAVATVSCRVLAARERRPNQVFGWNWDLLRTYAARIPDAGAGGHTLRHQLCRGWSDDDRPYAGNEFYVCSRITSRGAGIELERRH